MKHQLLTGTCAFFCGAFVASALASDWPQYLGPNRDSTSPEKGILRSWPEKGPEVLWAVSVGRGFGGPAIKDGKVYLLDRDDKVGDKLRCFALTTGEELWHFDYKAHGAVMFPGSRTVPTVDGNRVYTCGHNGDLYSIDINTHKQSGTKMCGRILEALPLTRKGGRDEEALAGAEDFPFGQLLSAR